ncbi:MAG: hypothetical protein LBM99_01385 [Bacillales bacterium]|jgi:hypothetical protein|nr:hypothetical protein [Bacillales bacterium]
MKQIKFKTKMYTVLAILALISIPMWVFGYIIGLQESWSLKDIPVLVILLFFLISITIVCFKHNKNRTIYFDDEKVIFVSTFGKRIEKDLKTLTYILAVKSEVLKI